MKKTGYRFVWESDENHFREPQNLSVANEAAADGMRRILDTIRGKSGLITFNTLWAVIIVIVLFVAFMIGAYLLVAANSPWGKAIIIGGPFLSFMLLAFLMIRKSGVNRVNQYLHKYQYELEDEAKKIGFTISSQFVKPDYEAIDKESKLTKCSKCTLCCVRCLSKEKIEGFVEFNEFNQQARPQHALVELHQADPKPMPMDYSKTSGNRAPAIQIEPAPVYDQYYKERLGFLNSSIYANNNSNLQQSSQIPYPSINEMPKPHY